MTTIPLHALGGLSVTEVATGEFQLVVNDTLASGTRSYNFGAATRTAVGAASVATALGTLAATREIMLTASTDCYVAFGTSSVSVAATDAAALRLFAGERFHLRVPSGVTHYAVIRDAADGYLRVTPVA
jgi:hypothetical protein